MLKIIPSWLFGGRHIRNMAPLALQRIECNQNNSYCEESVDKWFAGSGAEVEEDRGEDESNHNVYSSKIDSRVQHYESDSNGSKEF
jgi:hypothetical protein